MPEVYAMTKPKTVPQLLAEANKLAMERGFGRLIDTQCGGFVVRGDDWGELRSDIENWTKDQNLRCLIAALREVPVKGRKR